MKTFRILLPVFVITMLLTTTGCTLWNSWFGGEEEIPGNIPVEDPSIIDDGVPTEWGEPGAAVGGIEDLEPIPGIKMPTIYFSYDKENLGTSEKRKLDQVAKYLSSHPSIFLIIEGHCDERGSLEYNRSLGERRALSVKDYLATTGIAPEHLQTISYGEERPAVGGTGEAVFSKNRRAELIAAKKKK